MVCRASRAAGTSSIAITFDIPPPMPPTDFQLRHFIASHWPPPPAFYAASADYRCFCDASCPLITADLFLHFHAAISHADELFAILHQ
jgi:hypothetical protein